MHLVPRLIDFTEIIVNCSIWLYLLTKNDSQDTCFTALLLLYNQLKHKTVWNPHFFPSWLKTWLIKASTHRPGTRRRLFLSTTPNALLIFVQHNCLRKTRFLKIFFFLIRSACKFSLILVSAYNIYLYFFKIIVLCNSLVMQIQLTVNGSCKQIKVSVLFIQVRWPWKLEGRSVENFLQYVVHFVNPNMKG